MKVAPWLVCFLAGLSHAAAQPEAVFAFVKQNCVACHSGAKAAGEVDFSSLRGAESFDKNREVWQKVVSKLKTNEMPPPPLPRPPAAQVAAITGYIESEFARQDRTAKPDPGRVTVRRLNRAEYDNTVRDLLGVDIRPAANFPNDESAYGFDNNGDALTLPPVLVEKYLFAAEQVVRTAIFGAEKRKPAMVHYPTLVRIYDFDPNVRTRPKDMFNYDLSGMSTRHAAHVIHYFPADGEYSFRLVLNGHRPNQSDPAKPALFLDGKIVSSFEVDATDLEGQMVETRAFVKAGEHLASATYLKNYHGLPPSFGGPEPSSRPEVALVSSSGKLTENDIETIRKYGTKIKTVGVETRIDNRFESIDIGGPFTQPAGPSESSTRAIFICQAQTIACAQTIIANFTRRAFRRPVTAEETTPFVGLYTLARKQGDSFLEGIATALQGVLISPIFLYRIEDNPPGVFGPVSEFELASRLSYFLWSSMPDEALLDLAARKQLRQPGVLAAQVKRMLRDSRSRALVDNFVGQWLQFKNIDVIKPDPGKFPDFEDNLRLSMRRETELFFEELIRQDGNVLDVLHAGHTYLNERLARFYGVSGIEGSEFRRVDMSTAARGGGVLAHGSILTVTSYSTRTSPVLRGKWILENLLNAPPPPPPPAVPQLNESKAGSTASLRQQMEEHRKNPACASCHSRMDPLGFGLENLDAVGAWRDMEGKFPIDAAGVLPGGRKFQGPIELKKELLDDRHAYVQGLTEKLLVYALGRGLERFDRPAATRIAERLPQGRYRFSALVTEIAQSLPFQQRRSVKTSAGKVKSE